MWPYFAFAGLIAAGATLGESRRPRFAIWASMCVVAILFVGLRHHVGMDWNNYLRMIYSAESASGPAELFRVAEPLYAVLLLIGVWTGGGIYVVNLIATSVTMVGLFAFAKKTPNPWLALMAATPMLIVVVFMSANRQAIAIGLLMFVFANWNRFSLVARSMLILICAGFHASAIIFLGFVALDVKMPRALRGLLIVTLSLLAIYFLQQSGFAAYYDQAYGSGQDGSTESNGALLHVAINAIPAMLYFALPHLRPQLFPSSLLRNMAIAAILTWPLAVVTSAAAGRLSLYWFPVSMWVWAALPELVSQRLRRPVKFAICALMLTLLFIWLEFANSSTAHIPYRNALLISPWELEIGVLP